MSTCSFIYIKLITRKLKQNWNVSANLAKLTMLFSAPLWMRSGDIEFSKSYQCLVFKPFFGEKILATPC